MLDLYFIEDKLEITYTSFGDLDLHAVIFIITLIN